MLEPQTLKKKKLNHLLHKFNSIKQQKNTNPKVHKRYKYNTCKFTHTKQHKTKEHNLNQYILYKKRKEKKPRKFQKPRTQIKQKTAQESHRMIRKEKPRQNIETTRTKMQGKSEKELTFYQLPSQSETWWLNPVAHTQARDTNVRLFEITKPR